MTVKVVVIDRRSFLGGARLMAGAVVAYSVMPLSSVHALPSGLSLSAAPATVPGPATAPGMEGNGHVDDICGHWPPYSHAIGYGHVTAPAASLWAHADPIDHLFLI